MAASIESSHATARSSERPSTSPIFMRPPSERDRSIRSTTLSSRDGVGELFGRNVLHLRCISRTVRASAVFRTHSTSKDCVVADWKDLADSKPMTGASA
jgi:hypothetical protein